MLEALEAEHQQNVDKHLYLEDLVQPDKDMVVVILEDVLEEETVPEEVVPEEQVKMETELDQMEEQDSQSRSQEHQ
jgi:hypothetical protein